MRLWEFAVHRWRFTSVVFFLLVALGLYALAAIPRQEDPTFPIPLATIIVVYPGADPVDVERLAVDPIEDALSELDDVQDIRSTSESGLGVIRVQFEWSTDPERKYDEVVREVNALRGTLPDSIASITFKKANPGLVNIVQAALVSESADARTLKRLSEDLERSIESVPGVRRAETWGYPQAEIRASIDLARLGAQGLDLRTIADTVGGEGQTIPSGAVDAGPRRYTVNGTGDYPSLEAVADTTVALRDGRPVRLSDVADVRWSIEEPLYLARFDGQRAAFITGNMKDGYNIFAVQEGIKARFDAFRQTLPPDVRLVVGFEQARNVQERLSHLTRDFALALGLVLLTLLPLGLRQAGLVMLAIPLSLSIGMAGLWALGYSLNQISIAGFVVALGLLVDDAIVVVENIARHRRAGASRVDAAIQGTGQIAMAVLGCTAVLILAFLPLLNLPEGAGKFTRGLPLAVVLTVIASLLVALTIMPFLASRLLPRDEPPAGNRLLRAVEGGIHLVYAPVMKRALAHPRLTLLLGGALVAGAFALAPAIGFSLFPAADKPQFLVTIRAAQGSSLAATDEALSFVDRTLAMTAGVTHRMGNLGHGNPQIYYNIFPAETSATVAEEFVTLDHWNGDQSAALLESLRRRFDAYPDARIAVEAFQNGPPIEAPIAVRVLGPDLAVLDRLARDVESAVAAVPGVRDVTNPLRLPKVDLDLGFDLAKAGLLGVSSLDIDRTVRMAIAGTQVATYRDERSDAYPVRLRLPIDTHPTPALLDQLYFTSRSSGASIPFRQLAKPHFESGSGEVRRFDRQRMASVTANVAAAFVSGKVTEQVYRSLGSLTLPPGYRIEAGGEAEATSRSLGGLGSAILVASFGILAVLVLEFGSFRSVLIVASVIPFGFLGAVVALWATGHPMSYMAIIGLVALVGVETKNSILLVDFTNQLRREGMGLRESIEKAGEQRFFPVLLTSVTAIGGLTPLALGGSALYGPLAIVMIGGLISSTLFARVVTPVMYQLLPPHVDIDSA